MLDIDGESRPLYVTRTLVPNSYTDRTPVRRKTDGIFIVDGVARYLQVAAACCGPATTRSCPCSSSGVATISDTALRPAAVVATTPASVTAPWHRVGCRATWRPCSATTARPATARRR